MFLPCAPLLASVTLNLLGVKFFAEKNRREKYALGGALNRLRNRVLCRAWEQWQQETLTVHMMAPNGTQCHMRMVPRMVRVYRYNGTIRTGVQVAEEMRRQAEVLRRAAQKARHAR